MDFDLSDLAFYGFPAAPVFSGSSLGDDANSPGPKYWKFLSIDQRKRLERIRGSRLLFNGNHRQYFLAERRTQFSFPDAKIGGIWGETVRQLYETLNVLGLISTKGADLLFGDEPILSVKSPESPATGDARTRGRGDAETTDDGQRTTDPRQAYIEVQEAAQRAFLADLVTRCDLAALFHQKAEDASCDGEAFLEAKIEDGQVWLADVPGEEIFPVGKPGPDRQYDSYDRFTVTRQPAADPKAKPIDLLLITHYLTGSITREVWKLQDGAKVQQLALDQWPLEPLEPPLQEVVNTGLDCNTITYVPNQLRHGQPINDYSGRGIELQDALNAKMSQIAWILAKHSMPKLSRHSRHAKADQHAGSDYSVEYNDDQAEKSSYITWDGQLQWAIKDRDFTLEQLLVVTESSPVLLGLTIGGNTAHATAYKSFRLMASNGIAKAARKANYWKAGIRRALYVCCEMAQTLPGVRFAIAPVTVKLRDGIPLDGLEEAQRLQTLRAAGLMSIQRGIREQIIEPAEAKAEIEELAAEEKAKAPTIFMGPEGGSAGAGGREGAPPDASSEEPQAEAAAESEREVVAA